MEDTGERQVVFVRRAIERRCVILAGFVLGDIPRIERDGRFSVALTLAAFRWESHVEARSAANARIARCCLASADLAVRPMLWLKRTEALLE